MSREMHIVAQLTQKQQEVLALVADNRTSKEIAAHLGISESAVNQRIETIRSRLGWIPRGELARRYRKLQTENSQDYRDFSMAWKKIQVPNAALCDQTASAGSVSNAFADGSHRSTASDGDGSQLTATLFQPDNTWLWRNNGATAFVRVVVTTAIIASSLAFAAIASSSFALSGP